MEVWAQALHALNHADENTDLSLVLDVIQGNNTIPVIVLDKTGHVDDYRNIAMDEKTAADSDSYVARYGKKLYEEGKYIKIHLGDSTQTNDYQLVCYDESTLLKRLASYPYWQLGIVMIFVVVAIFALLSSKRAVRNSSRPSPTRFCATWTTLPASSTSPSARWTCADSASGSTVSIQETITFSTPSAR